MAEAERPPRSEASGDEPSRSAIFGQRVRRFREERGWSQGELTRQLAKVGQPLGQSRVSAIEAPGPEPRTVSIDQAQALADAFGVPLELLIFEDWPITRTVIMRELADIIEHADREAAQAVERANAARELAIRFLHEQPGQLPDELAERLPPIKLRRGSRASMKRQAATKRRKAYQQEQE